ncbi:unnamed protein product [Protopolystoma xenopodis]|uniref:Uncharacterized protein n=1 Tax=Protopolystoma xenopodis TaxID=117903 RepID=A0A448XQJ0_9PLAT|nr:unnamed protein product [Protopolystoma xenopodis]
MSGLKRRHFEKRVSKFDNRRLDEGRKVTPTRKRSSQFERFPLSTVEKINRVNNDPKFQTPIRLRCKKKPTSALECRAERHRVRRCLTIYDPLEAGRSEYGERTAHNQFIVNHAMKHRSLDLEVSPAFALTLDPFCT